MSRFRRPARAPFRFSPRVEVLDDRITPSLFTTLDSLQGDGTQATTDSKQTALSADGRFVAFITTSKLVADDTNGFADVYLKDRSTGAVTLISRGDGVAGAIGNGATAFRPSVSGDGRFVSFDSTSSNLVAADADAIRDTYVRDTVAGTTTLVSVSTAGVKGDNISGLTSISADGKSVAFASNATNLVTGDTNTQTDIFVRNLTTNTTIRASTDSAGGQATGGASLNSSISADGRFVVFDSTATNLVLNDTNAKSDVFLKDTITGATTRVSVASDGTQGNGNSGAAGAGVTVDISADGKFIVYQSDATNLVTNDTNGFTDVFLRDVVNGTTTRMSTDAANNGGNAASTGTAISGNGRFIAFQSGANNLVAGDGNGFVDIFVKDRITGAITRANISKDGVEANGASETPDLSRTGEFVSFDSGATNLVAVDGNGSFDAFVHQRPLPALYVAAPSAGGSSLVRVFNADGTEKFTFQAYDPAYTGGVFVALGDVNGDGVEDIVTSTGKGGTANIRVFDGITGSLNGLSFFAYPPAFLGGVNVAIGDVNNDGFADIICGVGVGGGPNVRVLDGKQVSLGNFSLSDVSGGGALLASFFAYPEGFTGGVRVASADVNADGFADVICGVGSGGGPNVRVLDGQQLSKQNYLLEPTNKGGVLISSFFALPESFTGGVFIGTGDIDNDRFSDVIIGVESGGGPNVRAYNAKTGTPLPGTVGSFFGFDNSLTGGVRVASTDLNQDGFDDFVLGTGPGTPSLLRIFSGKDASTQLFPQFAPFGGFNGGVNVG